MAIDPLISLAARAPDVSGAINIFENAMMNSQTRGIRQAQEQRAAELQPFQLQQAQQGVDINQQTLDANQVAAQQNSDQRILKSINDFAIGNQSIINQTVNTGDTAPLLQALTTRRDKLVQQGLPIDETNEAITDLERGDIQSVVSGLSDGVALFRQQQGRTAGQREFESATRGLTEEDKLKARRIELGLDPRASLSANERIATNTVLGDQVVEQKAAESRATETGKSKAQLKFKPAITRAVKLAEKAAAEQGDVLTDLARAEAGLPGLIESTNNLKELASVATSTYGGRFFDEIAKQSGWGSTKGGNARAKYIAIIDNQVLPLLKQTFGGAMTEGEGLRLSNTFGDPDATPEQKMLQTEAFIEQKLRDIDRLKLQADSGTVASDNTQVLNFDAQGNLIE
jgi:hypothetical protein